jgi:hypothetical protein
MNSKVLYVGLLVISGSIAPGLGEAAEGRIPWLSIAPEVGYLYVFKGELENDYHSEVPSRHGVVVKGHLDLGGDGLAAEFAPLFTWQSGDAFVGDFTGVGGEVGVVYRYVSGDLHPGVGVGLRGVYYVQNNAIERGVDLTARIPVGMTWYFADLLGLVLEAGAFLGGTGIRFRDDTADPIRSNLSEKTEYALVVGFDLLVGLRFP